jgi:hypothetical protein
MQGGKLTVSHNGLKYSVHAAASSPWSSHFLAFYADCEHTMEEVTDGLRLSLVYDLVHTAGKLPLPPGISANQATLVSVLQAWANDKQAVDTLLVMCKQPSPGRVRRSVDLTGADAGVAAVLELACNQGHLQGALVFINYERQLGPQGTYTRNSPP